ncbi:MAG: hypothetical protein IKU58_01085, partial [Clostridia bacterium]|nr:hypothetical protein [Clostridia bacterium]
DEAPTNPTNPVVESLDEEPPLADEGDEAPEEAPVEEELIEIPDDASPLADVPVTGDMMLVYAFASSVCGLALAAVLKKEQ